MVKPTQIGSTDRNCTHLAGEFFVAAELSKRGYAVGLTMGNAKAIDLFAEKGNRTVNVQVKAISLRKSVGWPILRKKVQSNVVYVLVCLNDCENTPTYFILTPQEARARVKEYATRGIINMYTVNSQRFKNRWDKVEHALRPL